MNKNFAMKVSVFSIHVLLIFLLSTTLSFATVHLYVDAAPNVYGSLDYAPWETNAFQAASLGTFVNMANSYNSANIGTTNFEIQDEVVYSFGDLGRRLTWIYWVPGETIASLEDSFEIKLENWWNGAYLDFYDDYYGSSWLTPTKWLDYDSNGDGTADGVIGTAGMAWWGAYGINTQEALDADIASWGLAEEQWTFTARYNQNEYSITSYRAPVPEPGTIALLGIGLAGLGLYGYRRRSKV